MKKKPEQIPIKYRVREPGQEDRIADYLSCLLGGKCLPLVIISNIRYTLSVNELQEGIYRCAAEYLLSSLKCLPNGVGYSIATAYRRMNHLTNAEMHILTCL